MNIECQNVWKLFGEGLAQTIALQDVSLGIADNEFITLVGASGCGKSTLLRTLAGLETQSRGQVLVDGHAISGPGQERAMVFQNYSLYPWLRVLENIRFCRQLGVHTDGRSSGDVEAASGRADALLQLMGLTASANAYPNQLSGGMQQRVAIARADGQAADFADGRALWRIGRTNPRGHVRPDPARASAGAHNHRFCHA